uniref:AlNc14C119G6613 protein n=1 Tax=Albugo laibachii Nc14 TaxID=890382 RepID=F0WJ81_9STRA|nr:AlNc14C119G6613 [Albugo laibachii Nc14]|eukprot:CCA21328.1 AlNc14C119G6613 [Albugo laibachii Nc14]
MVNSSEKMSNPLKPNNAMSFGRAAALAGGIGLAAWYIVYRRDTRAPPTDLNADVLNRDMGTTQQSRMPPPSSKRH